MTSRVLTLFLFLGEGGGGGGFSLTSLSSYETGQSEGGAKTGKPLAHPQSRTWLVSHVARAALEPPQDTAVR